MTAANRRPKILAARLLPPNVEARLARDFAATSNPDDVIWSADELVARAAGTTGWWWRARRR